MPPWQQERASEILSGAFSCWLVCLTREGQAIVNETDTVTGLGPRNGTLAWMIQDPRTAAAFAHTFRGGKWETSGDIQMYYAEPGSKGGFSGARTGDFGVGYGAQGSNAVGPEYGMGWAFLEVCAISPSWRRLLKQALNAGSSES